MFALVLVIGILCRILFLSDFSRLPVFQHVVGADVSEYWEQANAIAAGAGGLESGIHAPLYPLFLAGLIRLTGGGMFAIRLIQSVLAMLSAVPFFLVLRRRFGSRRGIPELFALVYVLYPPLIAQQCEFYSENLVLPLLSIACWFYDGHKNLPRMLLCGLFCGLAVIAHPLSGFFPLILAADLLIAHWHGFRKSMVRAFVLAAGTAMVSACVVIPSSLNAGHFVPVQKGGAFNFWLGNAYGADASCRIPPGRLWDLIHVSPSEYGMTDTAYFLRDTAASWRRGEHPVRAAGQLLFRKAGNPFSPRELTTWSDVSPVGRTFLHKYLYHWLFALIGIPALAALFAFGRRRIFRCRMGVFLPLLAAFWLAQAVFVSSGRYRMPMIPAVCALAVYGTAYAFFRKNGRRAGWRFCQDLALFGLAAGILAWFAPVHAAEIPQAKSYLAEAWLLSGDPEKARKELPDSGDHIPLAILERIQMLRIETAVESKDYEAAKRYLAAADAVGLSNGAAYHAARGRLAEKTGDTALAAASYEEALKTAAGHLEAAAAYNYGVLKMGQGDTAGAKMLFERTIRLEPAFVSAWTNLGVLAMTEERYGDAVQAFETAWKLDSAAPSRIVNLAAAKAFAGDRTGAKALLEPLIRGGGANAEAKDLWIYLGGH